MLNIASEVPMLTAVASLAWTASMCATPVPFTWLSLSRVINVHCLVSHELVHSLNDGMGLGEFKGRLLCPRPLPGSHWHQQPRLPSWLPRAPLAPSLPIHSHWLICRMSRVRRPDRPVWRLRLATSPFSYGPTCAALIPRALLGIGLGLGLVLWFVVRR